MVIWRGGERTKRVEEVREKLKAALSHSHPLEDGQLPQSLSRVSHSGANSEKTSLKNTTGATQAAHESTAKIDEHMVIPSAQDIGINGHD